MEDTKKKVLVVVDMQHDFIDGVLGTSEARAIVPKVVEKINSWDGPVILTMDTHNKDTYEHTTEGKDFPVLHCVEYTDGWCIEEQVYAAAKKKGANLLTCCKETFGSMHLNSMVIGEALRQNFELVGLCTDVCVISNAVILRNLSPFAEVTVDASCCAGVTPEKHRIALEAMKNCGIKVINDEPAQA